MTLQVPLFLPRSAEDVEVEFSERARETLLEMKKNARMSFEDIAKELALRDLGAETAGQLKAKFRRGKFSHVFFMRVALAMNIVEVSYAADMRWQFNGSGKTPTMDVRFHHVSDD